MAPKKVIALPKPNWTPIKVAIGLIKPWEHNPRTSTSEQAQKIIESEQKFGRPIPFLIMPMQNGKYPLLDGHQRLAAWQQVYGLDYKMDAMLSDRLLSEKEIREFIITVHASATGSWNWEVLAGWDTQELVSWGLAEESTQGWKSDAAELDKIIHGKGEESNTLFGKQDGNVLVNGKHNAFEITEARLIFDTPNIYGIPDLREDMLWDEDITGLKLWAGDFATAEAPCYYYNYRTDSTHNMPFKKTLLGFYTDDKSFETAVWQEFSKFTSNLHQRQMFGLVVPNFSHFVGEPRIERLYAYYKSAWCGRFWQEAGLKIIPDLKLGYMDKDQCLAGIPKHAPVAATQFNTSTSNPKSRAEHIMKKGKYLEEVLDFLKPKILILYATTFEYNKIIKNCQRVGTKTVHVLARSEARADYIKHRKEVNNNG